MGGRQRLAVDSLATWKLRLYSSVEYPSFPNQKPRTDHAAIGPAVTVRFGVELIGGKRAFSLYTRVGRRRLPQSRLQALAVLCFTAFEAATYVNALSDSGRIS